MSSSTSSSRARGFLACFAAGLVLCELAAALVWPVSRGRHEADELVALVDGGRAQGDVVLLSDSVSYGVLDLVEGTDDLVDLTSNRVVSVAGNAFLLRRYYEHAEDPARAVLYVASPLSLHSNLDSKTLLESYFTSVFTRSDEIAAVDERLDRPDLVEALEIHARAVAFPSHVRRGHVIHRLDRWLRTLKGGLSAAPGGVPVELSAAARQKIDEEAAETRFLPSPVTQAFLPVLAETVERNGARLVLTPCPLAPTVIDAWRANGLWDEYLAWMEAFAAEHEAVEFRPELPFVADDDRLFYDGVHLTPALKRAWGERLAHLARSLVQGG